MPPSRSAMYIFLPHRQKKRVSSTSRWSRPVGGERGLVFDNVLVRSGEGHEREIHLDTDEGNAAGSSNKISARLSLKDMRELRTLRIDHTLLKAEATEDDIRKAMPKRVHKFFAVCVNSCYVALAKKELAGTDVKIASVIGFPLGAAHTAAKAAGDGNRRVRGSR